MRAGRAVPLADPDLAVDDEDDVRAEVTVPAHDHAGVVARIQREVLRIRAEREPLLPDRRLGPVRVALPLHLLPRDVGVVEVPERWVLVAHETSLTRSERRDRRASPTGRTSRRRRRRARW